MGFRELLRRLSDETRGESGWIEGSHIAENISNSDDHGIGNRGTIISPVVVSLSGKRDWSGLARREHSNLGDGESVVENENLPGGGREEVGSHSEFYASLDWASHSLNIGIHHSGNVRIGEGIEGLG